MFFLACQIMNMVALLQKRELLCGGNATATELAHCFYYSFLKFGRLRKATPGHLASTLQTDK